MDQKALIALLQSIGVSDVKNYMSAIDTDTVERVRRHLEKSKAPAVVEERIRPTVVKRRSAPKAEASGAVPAPAPSGEVAQLEPPPAAAPSVEVPAARASVREPVVEAVPAARASARVTKDRAPEVVVPAERPSRSTKAEPAVAAPPPAPVEVAAKPALEPVIAPPPPVAPKAETKSEPAKAEAPKAEAPKAEAPKAEPVKTETKVEAAPAEAPKAEAPKAEPAKAEAPKAEPAKAEAPKAEPATETKTEAKSEPAKAEPAKAEAPKAEAAPAKVEKAEEPTPAKTEAKAEPKVEKAEPAKVEAPAPAKAEPAVATPKTAEKPAPAQAATPAASSPKKQEPLSTAAPVAIPPAPPVPQAMGPATPPPSAPPASAPNRPSEPPRPSVPGGSRPSAPPKTGIEVWGGRPGVPMPQQQSAKPAPYTRRTQVDPRQTTTARPGAPQGQRPQQGGRPGGPGGRPNGPGGRRPNQAPASRRPMVSSTKEMAAEKKVVKIEGKINLQTLAAKMSLKATEVLMKLLSIGMTGVNVNSALDADTAKLLASEFGWEVEDVAVSEDDQLKAARGGAEFDTEEGAEPRPPIVTVMGHVDHGKTSLLDQIRKTAVAAGEAGGITQHIGAYRVQTSRGPVTFLDTPGHEAFTQMRARGASVTDIVILVVAADDGVMPQTREAVNHARAAKCPIIVAMNKIDKPEADPDRIVRQLMELELVPEELGGDTLFCRVSAKTREGLEELLEAVALQAEMMELRASSERPGHGTVVEALLDRGKGPVARVLVTDGTLRVGDFLLAGPAFGKVRAMTDDRGRNVVSAGPSTPVEVLGLSDVPNAGDNFDVVKDPKKAQELAETRRDKNKTATTVAPTRRTALEIFNQTIAEANQLELRLILKADVQGSVEAVGNALSRLSGEKVKLSIIHSSVGAITEGDVNLAIASKAIIVGFNVRPAGKAAQLAESEGIEIRQYSIIYHAVDDIRAAMEGKLAPTYIERLAGKAEIRQVFNLSKAGLIAGCMVIEGLIKRNLKVRVKREGAEVYVGKITGLKRFKEDVKDVAEGFECGISLDDFEGMAPGDIIEAYDVDEVRQKLS
ncbi:MAG: translation initiation factor IF-2 [Polyangiaceae bacterium]